MALNSTPVKRQIIALARLHLVLDEIREGFDDIERRSVHVNDGVLVDLVRRFDALGHAHYPCCAEGGDDGGVVEWWNGLEGKMV